MKRYVVPLAFSLVIVLLYTFLDVRFFSMGLAQFIRQSLFNNFYIDRAESDVVVLNIGDLESHDVIAKIDTLLKAKPKVIGIDICAYPTDHKGYRTIIEFIASKKNIVPARCNTDSRQMYSSMIVNSNNTVTHFSTDDKNYYESKLTGFTTRGNTSEMINWREDFFAFELNDAEMVLPESIEGKVVLIGYVGRYLSDEVLNYENAHITPLNKHYGDRDVQPDMDRLFVSANIVSTIIDNDFIHEVGQIARVFTIFLFLAINVVLLTYIKAKKLVWNILIALATFVILNMAGTFLIVQAFSWGYYLAMDEITICLLVTTICTLALNVKEKK